MKKQNSVCIVRALGFIAFIAIMGFSLASCLTYDAQGFYVSFKNLNDGAWAPDPDKADDKMEVVMFHKFPKGSTAAVKGWTIRIQPVTQEQEGGQARQPAGEGRRRRAFYEESGEGSLPSRWYWDGRGSARTNSQGETRQGRMAQSAQEYQFAIVLTDTDDTEYTYETTFDFDLLVVRDGDNLRIVVPSITFKPSSPELVTEGNAGRTNTRVLNLIARALNKFKDYSVTVEGYSNPTTPPNTAEREKEIEDDIPLTEGRANSVVADLGTKGISRDRLTSVGRGCANPSVETDADNYDDDSWQNRRVEFLLNK